MQIRRSSRRRGATAIEYALVAVIIGLALVAGATSLGISLDGVLDMAAEGIDEANEAW